MTKNYNDLGVEFKYLIVNDMDQKYGLWVNTVGFQSIQPNSPYPLKDHPTGYFFNAQKGRILREYQLVYITKGRGVFSSETTPEKQVCKGRLMVLFPGQWHTYYPYVQTGWNEYYIGFEGAVIDDMVKGGFLSKENQVLEVGLNEELVSLFSRALEIAEADKISSQQYLAGIVLHMIGMILSISKNKIFEVGDVDQLKQSQFTVGGRCGVPPLPLRLDLTQELGELILCSAHHFADGNHAAPVLGRVGDVGHFLTSEHRLQLLDGEVLGLKVTHCWMLLSRTPRTA